LRIEPALETNCDHENQIANGFEAREKDVSASTTENSAGLVGSFA